MIKVITKDGKKFNMVSKKANIEGTITYAYFSKSVYIDKEPLEVLVHNLEIPSESKVKIFIEVERKENE